MKKHRREYEHELEWTYEKRKNWFELTWCEKAAEP